MPFHPSFVTEYHRKRRQTKKQQAYKLLGGKCVECGSANVVEMHQKVHSAQYAHTDSKYTFIIAQGASATLYFDLRCADHRKRGIMDKEQRFIHPEPPIVPLNPTRRETLSNHDARELQGRSLQE